jgi:hypothetical protein
MNAAAKADAASTGAMSKRSIENVILNDRENGAVTSITQMAIDSSSIVPIFQWAITSTS